MGIIGVLDIGKTALAAQRIAIEVTGENIANVNTPGYSRQSAVLETASGNLSLVPLLGNGVRVASIQRSYDQFLQQQINSGNSASGEQTAMNSALKRMESLFNELSSDGLGKSMQTFFNAWQDLSMNPQGETERQAVLADSQKLVDDFHRINGSLNDVKRDADQSLIGITAYANGKAAQIAALNGQIRSAEMNGAKANELRDSRDLLIRDLAGITGISALEQADGTVSVSLTRGPRLVDGDQASTFVLQPDAANAGYYGIILKQPGEVNGTDVTAILKGADGKTGQLGGTLQVRDNLANGFLANLDELAHNLAVQVNSLHSAGFGLNGSNGINFFTPPPAPAPPATFAAGFSGSIALNVSTTGTIAAAASDPTLPGNGSGDNTNSLRMAGLKNLTLSLGGGSSTLTNFFSSLVGKVGIVVQNSDQGLKQSQTLLSQLDNLRESTAGVSLDEELAALIKYQKAYEGAAKLINTGAEMIDTILNMVR